MQVNWMGTSVFVFYICAFGFYLWIRIAKTLDLGQYLGYGIFVLIVECMGATTVILYGTNLLWNPVNEIVLQESEDGIGPGKLKVINIVSLSSAICHLCCAYEVLIDTAAIADYTFFSWRCSFGLLSNTPCFCLLTLDTSKLFHAHAELLSFVC